MKMCRIICGTCVEVQKYKPTFLQQKTLRCPGGSLSSFASFFSSSPFQTLPWRLADTLVQALLRLNARSGSRCRRDTNLPRGLKCPGETGRIPSPSCSPRRFLFFVFSSFFSSFDPPVTPLQLARQALRQPVPQCSASSSSSSSSSCFGETAELRC